jgi:hypothetical protein
MENQISRREKIRFRDLSNWLKLAIIYSFISMGFAVLALILVVL